MEDSSLLWQFWDNFRHNLFKPLLLFFYMGFSVPLLRVPFDFPHVIYQGLTIYLLIAIGWHGGEELADLSSRSLAQAAGLMVIGFALNFLIGCAAYLLLRSATKLRRIDAATIAGYYGSDSAGTFVTCVGILTGLQSVYGSIYKPAPYMPVMLAVMEIPGCLVALYLVSRLRHGGMDPLGNMPDEPGYDPAHRPPAVAAGHGEHSQAGHAPSPRATARGAGLNLRLLHEVFLNPGLFLLFGGIFIGYVSGRQRGAEPVAVIEFNQSGSMAPAILTKEHEHLDPIDVDPPATKAFKPPAIVMPLQKYEEVADNVRQRTKSSMEQLDTLFLDLFQGALCLFLLEMGMTACKRLRDLRAGGVPFILFGLIAPNVFATVGMIALHLYGMLLGEPFTLGTYPLFAVLCAAASYIAVPAVQRMAIPEASPTLPLAASLGLTFSYNVTVGIPVYIMIAQTIMKVFPIG
ncbi:MAG TPA: sodium-dependent bicarbonate transport family permease [Pirellulales bacterium]|nr:sodium-dependent bicarbonate transport family permease [Pirellulales bacterium]